MLRRLFLKLLFSPFVAGNARRSSAATSHTNTIAFGCCNHVHHRQPMWQHILARKPELFLWLGDVVYADTEDPAEMRAMFNRQYALPDYATLRKNIPIHGIWDDHDYGGNNQGKENAIKQESQQIFLDFLDEPPDSPRRKQQGIYTSHSLGSEDREVKLILLDTRFHRDRPGIGRADTLGDAQWRWLENELKHSTAKIHLIASGYSVLSTQIPGAEEWNDFQWARKRLFHLLEKYNTSGVLFLTGDRHFAAHLKQQVSGTHWHEFMSSGLTHYLFRPRISRVLRAYYGKHNSFFGRNFGLLDISWQQEIQVTFRVFDQENQQQLAKALTLTDGQWSEQ